MAAFRLRLPIETVRETAGIIEGAPFDPQVPVAARARLVALYRREAFPSPDVTVKQTVSETEPAVDVAFVITEGPRQVLGDVVVTGNRAIDSDVIVRALGLEINQPLRPEESLRARTRVFETGLFRRVDISPEMVEARADTQAHGADAPARDGGGVAGAAAAIRLAGGGGTS